MSRLFAGTPFDKPSTCPKCGKTPANCRCLDLPEKTKMSQKGKPQNQLDSGLVLTPENSNIPKDQIIKIRVEKRKGNRLVTVLSSMDHPANDLPALCTALKQSLGTGGSVQARTIEIQGDHADAIAAQLTAKGLKNRVL